MNSIVLVIIYGLVEIKFCEVCYIISRAECFYLLLSPRLVSSNQEVRHFSTKITENIGIIILWLPVIPDLNSVYHSQLLTGCSVVTVYLSHKEILYHERDRSVLRTADFSQPTPPPHCARDSTRDVIFKNSLKENLAESGGL